MSTYAWSRLDISAGLGFVRMEPDDSIRAEGHEIAVDGNRSWVVTFEVQVDSEWRTRRAEVFVSEDHESRRVALESNGRGSWHLNGAPAGELEGCLDVDIAATPFTNTLVIRRLGLPVDASSEVRVAWVGVPDLEVKAMKQTYLRLRPLDGTDRYEYRSRTASDGRVIEVDQDGIALDYEGFAHRLYPDPSVE